MQNFTTSHDDIETLWDDPKVTVQERRNSFRNKKQTSSRRRKFLSDDEQGENSRFRSIFEEVKRDFEQLNARQTHMDIAGHTSMPNMVASGISLEASLNDLSTGSSDGKKGSLKDRMMLTAATFEEHLYHREDHKRSGSLGDILEAFPRQQRRKFLGGEISKQLGCSSETSSKTAQIKDFAFDRSRLVSKAVPKSSIAMMRQARYHDDHVNNRTLNQKSKDFEGHDMYIRDTKHH
jgi:hypothetical protein